MGSRAGSYGRRRMQNRMFERGRVRRAMFEYRNVTPLRNENSQIFMAALLIEVLLQPLAQQARVRTDDAVIVRIVIGWPLEYLYSHLLFRDLIGTPAQG